MKLYYLGSFNKLTCQIKEGSQVISQNMVLYPLRSFGISSGGICSLAHQAIWILGFITAKLEDCAIEKTSGKSNQRTCRVFDTRAALMAL